MGIHAVEKVTESEAQAKLLRDQAAAECKQKLTAAQRAAILQIILLDAIENGDFKKSEEEQEESDEYVVRLYNSKEDTVIGKINFFENKGDISCCDGEIKSIITKNDSFKEINMLEE